MPAHMTYPFFEKGYHSISQGASRCTSLIRFMGGQSTGNFKVRVWNVELDLPMKNEELSQLTACGWDLQLKLLIVVICVVSKINQRRINAIQEIGEKVCSHTHIHTHMLTSL